LAAVPMASVSAVATTMDFKILIMRNSRLDSDWGDQSANWSWS